MDNYRVPPTPMYVIKRGRDYLTLQPERWTRWRHAAAVFESVTVAQAFLRDLPEDCAGAELIPYLEEGRVRP